MRLTTLICSLAICAFSVGCAQKKKAETTKEEAHKTATTDNKKNSLSYACLVGKDLRVVEVEKSPKRCEVHYTKLLKEQVPRTESLSARICSWLSIDSKFPSSKVSIFLHVFVFLQCCVYFAAYTII